MALDSDRLHYGPRKYAALHLLLARWLRVYADRAQQYCYVTLGGTELRDVQSIRFVNQGLAATVVSYEEAKGRYRLALETAERLNASGSAIAVESGTFFSYKRRSDLPHIYFLDLEGICAWGDYSIQFARMFQDETIREGDCLIITSHLGHNRGWDEVRKHFSGELAALGIDENDAKKLRATYRTAHPTMTLFKALCRNRIEGELRLSCFGIVKYSDSGRTPMGLYGYSISGGTTALKSFVGEVAGYFDANAGCACAPDDF
jgi:hypothetical protein